MKKAVIFILTVCVLLFGCQKETQQADAQPDPGTTVAVEEIVIKKDQLSTDARFFNYEVDGVTVQMIAGIASDGTCRLSLNTCQNCSPSPQAYFTYQDNKLICMNCGNVFTMDDVGTHSGGCNPMNVEYTETEDSLQISTEVLAGYSRLFTNWAGPKE